jgi:hypothetical protein
VEPPAPVQVHQLHRRGGRRCERARLEVSDLGPDHSLDGIIAALGL